MSGRWIKVRGHRRFINGQSIFVGGYYRWVEGSNRRKSNQSNLCPYCNAKISTVHMPNGGFAHFETGRGLGRIKHPCFTIGDGMSKRRPVDMDDLFDDLD